ncbi:unnamed protein product [Nyctereutes procyonoides]|uniref:(raccoon dog) hypothetical protein n=1 Tax=Nyctereutes procyonoides TaxID=34880 RepID=A0A811YY06_NYCPR|nr:unnamed protein product [Nyctereutes procyonoides]
MNGHLRVVQLLLLRPHDPGCESRILPCCVNQMLTSTLVDNVFRIRKIEVSQASILGIIRNADRGMLLLPVGVYIKAIGVLKCFKEVKGLEVFNIRVLEDMNESTTHILEMVNAHMILDKAHQVASGPSWPVVPSNIDEVQNYGEYHNFHFIHKEEGNSVHELQTQLHSMSDRAIKQALDYLTNEGYIYPTVDEEHFKSAD